MLILTRELFCGNGIVLGEGEKGACLHDPPPKKKKKKEKKKNGNLTDQKFKTNFFLFLFYYKFV